MWSLLTWMRDFLADYAWFWWRSDDSKSNTILLIGLDDAGKTTLTGRLTQNRLIQASPTSQPSKHEVKIGSTLLAITDVGGHRQARRLWRDYMFASARLIFLVDASNRERLPEARHELLSVLKDEDAQQVPMLILANKVDNTETALSESELIHHLQIDSFLRQENARVKLCMCSIKRNEGFTDGLRWLIKQPVQFDWTSSFLLFLWSIIRNKDSPWSIIVIAAVSGNECSNRIELLIDSRIWLVEQVKFDSCLLLLLCRSICLHKCFIVFFFASHQKFEKKKQRNRTKKR